MRHLNRSQFPCLWLIMFTLLEAAHKNSVGNKTIRPQGNTDLMENLHFPVQAPGGSKCYGSTGDITFKSPFMCGI